MTHRFHLDVAGRAEPGREVAGLRGRRRVRHGGLEPLRRGERAPAQPAAPQQTQSVEHTTRPGQGLSACQGDAGTAARALSRGVWRGATLQACRCQQMQVPKRRDGRDGRRVEARGAIVCNSVGRDGRHPLLGLAEALTQRHDGARCHRETTPRKRRARQGVGPRRAAGNVAFPWFLRRRFGRRLACLRETWTAIDVACLKDIVIQKYCPLPDPSGTRGTSCQFIRHRHLVPIRLLPTQFLHAARPARGTDALPCSLARGVSR